MIIIFVILSVEENITTLMVYGNIAKIKRLKRHDKFIGSCLVGEGYAFPQNKPIPPSVVHMGHDLYAFFFLRDFLFLFLREEDEAHKHRS